MSVTRGDTRLLLALCAMSVVGCGVVAGHDTSSLLAPTLTRAEIVGLVAGCGTTFAAVPDLIAMLRRRSSAGMNPRMAGITGTFQLAWIYYGLLIHSRPVIVWNAVGVIVNLVSVGAFLRYARKDREASV